MLKFSPFKSDQSTMKRLNSRYFLTIVAMGFLSSLSLSYAQDTEAINREILDGVKEVTTANEELKKSVK